MTAVNSGLTIWQAIGLSALVFAGSAQLASIPLMAAHAPIWVIFVTAVVVNLRFVIFAAALAPHFAHLPWYKRVWYGYFNVDVTMGFFPQRFPLHTAHQPAGKVGFYAGLGYSNWYAWLAGSTLGVLLASQIPSNWGIGFAGTLALLTIMIPLIINAAALAGVVVATIVSVAAAGLPYRLGLVLAVVCGMIVAMAIDTVFAKKKEEA
jgi:predicted branched-subunit amino acid permease